MPLAASAVVGSLAASSLLRRPGAHAWVMPVALGLVAAGLALAARTALGDGAQVLVRGLVMAGVGLGLAQSFGIATAMDAVPAEAEGSGAALLNTVRQFGSVLGIAALGSVSGTVYTRGLSSLPAGLPDQVVQAVSDTVSSAHLVASRLPAGWAVAVADQADRAYVHAMDCVLAICAVTSGVVAVIAALAAVSRRVRRS